MNMPLTKSYSAFPFDARRPLKIVLIDLPCSAQKYTRGRRRFRTPQIASRKHLRGLGTLIDILHPLRYTMDLDVSS
jgi:hypothetical protein